MDPEEILRAVINRASEISDVDWNLMSPHIRKQKLFKNELFIETGQCNDTIGFVLKGALRTFYVDPNGADVSVHFQLEYNFVVSYESFVTGLPSTYTIEALEDCDLLIFNKNVFEECCKNAHAWERFARIVAEQMLVVSQRKMQSILYQTAEERYLNLLSTSRELMQRIPQYHVASYLGIKPESLSRIRKKILESERN